MMTFRFEAVLWQASTTGTWVFLSVPTDVVNEIRKSSPRPLRGFGSVPVTVSIGATSWTTSIFPDSKIKTSVLPVTKLVRTQNHLNVGDTASVVLTLKPAASATDSATDSTAASAPDSANSADAPSATSTAPRATLDEAALRELADEGNEAAEARLVGLALERDDIDELLRLADDGNEQVVGRLADLAAARGDVAELRRLVDEGSEPAEAHLAELIRLSRFPAD